MTSMEPNRDGLESDVSRVRGQLTGRLSALGIDLDGGESPEQLAWRAPSEARVPRLVATRAPRIDPVPAKLRALILGNGVGGFTPDGGEYVITTHAGQATPAPWSNVIANPAFGTLVSESGSAYTWSEHARLLARLGDARATELQGQAEAIYRELGMEPASRGLRLSPRRRR